MHYYLKNNSEEALFGRRKCIGVAYRGSGFRVPGEEWE